ncbi:glycerate kinase [Christensenellaceae bacterium OttesenSCG-928-K19]|nr:glycerate kinase [Christensenellaceae bacterium OttesenSCG-928-K19]
MKIIIAPDSFKETLSSVEICDIIGDAALRHIPGTEVVKIPVADGGEGMVDAYLAGCGGKKVSLRVNGPYFDEVDAFYGMLPDGKTAVIEMAAASGLAQARGKRQPMEATSFGTGQLICDAVAKGCSKIILGIGGSATMDGGIGMAQAMGVRFLDEDERAVQPTANGLADVKIIDAARMTENFKNIDFLIACDVKNILCGPDGAAYVFGKQKGASPGEIEQADENLRYFCGLLEKDSRIKLLQREGTGAAGGLALPLLAFCGAVMHPGIDLVLDVAGFDKHLDGADMVITGEGRLDGQSMEGKVPVGVAHRARQKDVPVVAVVGSVGEGYEKVMGEGIVSVFSTNKASTDFDEIKKNARQDLAFLADSLFAFKRL